HGAGSLCLHDALPICMQAVLYGVPIVACIGEWQGRGTVFLSSDPKRRLFLSSVGKTMIKLSFHQIINRARAEPMMQAGHNKNSRTNRRWSPVFYYALLVYSSTSASTSSVSAHSTADSASCSMSVFLRLEICLRAFNTDDALMENSSRPSPSSSGIAFSSPAISPHIPAHFPSL